MGCGSNYSIKDASNEKETINAFQKLEKSLKAYKEAINEYKKFLEEYGNILEQQIICEKDIIFYFKLQKKINMEKEPKEIKEYKKIFNRVNRLEKRLNIGPGYINKNKDKFYKNKEKKDNEKNETIEKKENNDEDIKKNEKTKKRK